MSPSVKNVKVAEQNVPTAKYTKNITEIDDKMDGFLEKILKKLEDLIMDDFAYRIILAIGIGVMIFVLLRMILLLQ